MAAENSVPLKREIADRYAGHGRYFRGTYSDHGLRSVASYRAQFPLSKTFLVHGYHPHDAHRYVLIGDQFKEHLTGSILDVGSRENVIKKTLGLDASLVDKNSASTEPLDLEAGKLPFADGEFDTVVCLDTLEHLDSLHTVVRELLRVARGRVIISLPNCWRKTFVQMLRGRSTQQAYGLPPERPMDRHKWFFNSEEIEDFFFYQAGVEKEYPFSISAVRQHMIPLFSPIRRFFFNLLRPLIPERHLKNIFVNTTYVVLSRG